MMLYGYDGFWSLTWTMFAIVAFAAYLFALFAVVADLFRDHTLGGVAKALWVIGLVFVPLVALLAYLIFRGPGMQARANREAEQRWRATDDFLRRMPHASTPAEEISRAKALRDDGTITEAEFETLKARALSSPAPAPAAETWKQHPAAS
ncbi:MULTISPECIES: SHOCT domain-containing protein [unclassified Microbacterium]|uniref:SHOCT domain-containing protein n=1 Tax=unclassified Microbacterium TaxID=2609290 RepID=UPI00203C5058|nr:MULTISPECIES: SHOCT domain-containing protein [unclassified Microbacterium]